MARPFTEDEFLFPRHPIERLVDAFDESVEVGRLKVAAREVRLDRYGRHIDQRAVQSEDPIHEHRIFVNLLLINFHKPLAHGLDVADTSEPPLQGGKEPQGIGGLTVVLPRCGNEYARSGGIQEHNPF